MSVEPVVPPDEKPPGEEPPEDDKPLPTVAEFRAMEDEARLEIKGKVTMLLNKRLDQALRRRPGRDGRLEDTHLISLYTNLLKADQAAQKGSAPDTRPAQVVNILTYVGSLPKERGAELIVAAIRQMEAAGQRADDQRAALAAHVGADEAERMLAIEA